VPVITADRVLGPRTAGRGGVVGGATVPSVVATVSDAGGRGRCSAGLVAEAGAHRRRRCREPKPGPVRPRGRSRLPSARPPPALGRPRARAAATPGRYRYRVAWDELGEGVLRRRWPSLDLNVGAVLGEDELLLVDTGSTPSEARALLAELRRVTRLPCRRVVNTHWHFDHCFGNAALLPAVVHGHRRCAALLRERGEEQRTEALRWLPDRGRELAGLEIVPPSRTLVERAEVEVGGRRVVLLHPGRGHTDHDVVVLVPDAGVLFAGDLVEEGAPPSFEDAWPLEWPAALGRLLQLGARTVVPGHGGLVDPGFVRGQREELEAMARLCREVRDGRLPAPAALARAPFPEPTAAVALRRAGPG
jgi:glyoxylase-like metal-dependent hydrolase (beta-lactamase superfamily II)